VHSEGKGKRKERERRTFLLIKEREGRGGVRHRGGKKKETISLVTVLVKKGERKRREKTLPRSYDSRKKKGPTKREKTGVSAHIAHKGKRGPAPPVAGGRKEKRGELYKGKGGGGVCSKRKGEFAFVREGRGEKHRKVTLGIPLLFSFRKGWQPSLIFKKGKH